MVMAAARMFLLNVPFAMLGNHWFGYACIFVATAVTNAVMGIWAYVWLRRVYFVTAAPMRSHA